jgi:uncharacterized protein involved in outer membrane biogenesis
VTPVKLSGLSCFCPARSFSTGSGQLRPLSLKIDAMAINLLPKNKWSRRLVWLVAAIILLVGLSWALVPPILKNQVEKIASEELGRKVTLGRVDFKPWTLELELGDITIAAADGTAGSQLEVKRVYLDAEAQSVWRLAPVVDAMAVEGLKLKVTHLGQGKYDFDDVLTRLANRPKKDDKTPSTPLRFAFFNLALTGASLDFVDKSVGKTHELRDLNLSVPFLSNLDSQREVKTEPHLAFKFNGSTFDSSAQSTPFTKNHKTDASIRLQGFDLKPYIGYIPAGVPVRLLGALVNAEVKVAFEQTSRPTVKLTGVVEARDVKLADRAGLDLLSFGALKVSLQDVRPLEQVVKLSMVELAAPRVLIARDKAGRLNLDFAADPTGAIKKEANYVGNTRANTGFDAKKPANPDVKPAPWQLDVAALAVRNGLITWRDDTPAPQALVTLNDVTLDARAITYPIDQPIQFSGTVAIQGGPASLKFEGKATDKTAQVSADLAELPLGLAAPYLAQFLLPKLNGSLASELDVNWKPEELNLAVKRLTLTNLALLAGTGPAAASGKAGKDGTRVKPAANALASLKKLEIVNALIALEKQTVTVDKVMLSQPGTSITREKDGRWMFEPLLKPPAQATPAHAATAHAAAAKPWAVSVSDIALDGGAFQFHDKTMAKPVALDISGVKVQVKNFVLDAKKPFGLNVFAKLKTPEGEPGQVDYKGNLALSPLSAQGKLQATQIPVHAFEPYFANLLNIELLRADAGFKGDVRYVSSANGPVVSVKGDSVLEEFRANGVLAGQTISDELLSWKALSVRGLDLAMSPGTATTVTVAETALTDFFARILVNEAGRINLQDLVKSSENAASAPDTPTPGVSNATNTVADYVTTTRANGQNDPKIAVKNPANGPEAIINIGPVSLVNGRVYFTDHFVKPNYSANLSELNGRLSAFSSVPAQAGPTAEVQMADLELRGRAEGTASLEILGKLNPLAKPLALDIKGKVRDLELPPLSPYSVKYAGHGIERGKLSVDVGYRVLPDGQLTATNNIILNQLKFGDKVEGAPASLPVKLAVALLADRNGVIDINLPVSGSLNDPQFRLGPIIFKVIVNLIVKAITSPFSLLASALGGGGDELSMVAFAPGSALLGPDAQVSLDKVAKALSDRPALKLTVVGTSNLDVEREAYKRERLKALLQTEKRRSAVVGGVASQAGAPGAVAVATVVSDAEVPALLKEVYKRADFPKPRNLVGMAKDIPGAEMEALLLANISVTEDSIRELALQRGVAVRDYLAGKQLPLERLFLGAAKPDAKVDAKADAKWTPRAELDLATN